MEQFMKDYGGAILAVISCIVVLGVLFSGIATPKGGTGLYSALGEGAEEISKQTQVSASADKIKEIKSRPFPEVTGNTVFANVEYPYSDVFAKTDQKILLEVKCVQTIAGEDMTEIICQADKETMCFPAAGTYRVRILTDDRNGGTADGWVTVKVQD